MSSANNRDKLLQMLSSLEPIEPRQGLEQEIFAKILQEPEPVSPEKRDWSWIRSKAAVASFVGGLVVLGAVLHTTQPQTKSEGAAPQTAAIFSKDQNPTESGANTEPKNNSVSSIQNNSTAKEASDSAAPKELTDNTASKESTTSNVRNEPENHEKSTEGTNNTEPGDVKAEDSLASLESDPVPETSEQALVVKSAVAAEEQGLRITLYETQKEKKMAIAKTAGPFLTADELKRIVEELTLAKPESIAINGVPVTTADPIESKEDALYVKEIRLEAPYVLTVTGDPKQLRESIEQKESYILTLKDASKVEISIEEFGKPQ